MYHGIPTFTHLQKLALHVPNNASGMGHCLDLRQLHLIYPAHQLYVVMVVWFALQVRASGAFLLPGDDIHNHIGHTAVACVHDAITNVYLQVKPTAISASAPCLPPNSVRAVALCMPDIDLARCSDEERLCHTHHATAQVCLTSGRSQYARPEDSFRLRRY